MRLRTFNGDIPLTAGALLLKKVPEIKYKDLHKLWFTNSAIASSTSTVSYCYCYFLLIYSNSSFFAANKQGIATANH